MRNKVKNWNNKELVELLYYKIELISKYSLKK